MPDALLRALDISTTKFRERPGELARLPAYEATADFPLEKTTLQCWSGPVEVDQIITCIDIGGRAHLVSYPPEERDWEPGDLIVYRCEDCLDRWDLVVPDDDADGP